MLDYPEICKIHWNIYDEWKFLLTTLFIAFRVKVLLMENIQVFMRELFSWIVWKIDHKQITDEMIFQEETQNKIGAIANFEFEVHVF